MTMMTMITTRRTTINDNDTRMLMTAMTTIYDNNNYDNNNKDNNQ